MSTASPTAFLVWAILSILFLTFLIYHLWCYDRFKCLQWSSGRQPGAFKRVMTYSYLGAVPLFTVYSVAMTVIKFKEGFVITPDHQIIPKPFGFYSRANRNWIIPLDFVFSIAWALELVTHLEELAFWLYLLHQNPQKEDWFHSWEYRLWYLGSIIAMLGMPLTALVTRKDIDTCDAWIFLIGSSGSTTTTLCFLYVLWGFPRFIRHVKSEGADPSVVVRLATFYALNLVRVVFRFLFTVPLFILAIDGLAGSAHIINRDLFWTDFLTMIAGIGCFVSTAITLLIFFPRSIVKESGYKPKPPTIAGSPKSVVSPHSPHSMTPHALSTGHFEPSMQSHFRHQDSPPDDWPGDDDTSFSHHYHYAYGDQAPPYVGVHELHEQYVASPPASPSPIPHAIPPVNVTPGADGVHQRQPFPHSLSSPHILSPPLPPTSPQEMRVALPLRRTQDVQRARLGQGLGIGIAASPSMSVGSASTVSWKRARPPGVEMGVVEVGQQHREAAGLGRMQRGTSARAHRRNESSSLHPYVMTFTSPIDLADISPHLNTHDPLSRTL